MTYRQYENFRSLPIIEKCTIVERDIKLTEEDIQEINKAIELAISKDTSHVKKLSKN